MGITSFATMIPEAPNLSSSSSFFSWSGSCVENDQFDDVDFIVVTDNRCYVTKQDNAADRQGANYCECEIHKIVFEKKFIYWY